MVFAIWVCDVSLTRVVLFWVYGFWVFDWIDLFEVFLGRVYVLGMQCIFISFVF